MDSFDNLHDAAMDDVDFNAHRKETKIMGSLFSARHLKDSETSKRPVINEFAKWIVMVVSKLNVF